FGLVVHHNANNETGVLADGLLDDTGDIGVVAQELLGVLAALADALAAVREPRPRLLHHTGGGAEVDELADLRDPFAIHDVELHHPERQSELVLHHLHPGLAADHRVTLLNDADTANIEPNRGIELQRITARGGLGIAEHDADLHADL